VEILHEGNTIEVYKAENGLIGLRHPEVKVRLSALLTTAGGTKAVGEDQDKGQINFPATTLKIKTRQDDKGRFFAHHAIFSFWVNREGEGMRPAGDCSLDVICFVKKIVAGAPYECKAQIYVPSEDSSTTEVKVSLTSDATTLERQNLAAWLHKDSDARRLLTQRMVSREDVALKLRTIAINRFQQTNDRLNGMYGGMNKTLALPEMDTSKDTLGSTSKVDPTQMKYLIEKYNFNSEMVRKNAVPIARNAVLALAELCAFELRKNNVTTGEHIITMKEFMNFVGKLNSTPAKPAMYAEYIGILENTITGFDADMRTYVNDEELEFHDDTLRASQNVGEKMDIACGRSSMTFVKLRKQIENNAKVITSLREDIGKLDPANASLAAQIRLNSELLGAAIGKQFGLRHSFLYTNGDCEDGGFYTVVALKLLQSNPDMIFEHVQKFVGTSFLSVHMAFEDPAEPDPVKKLQRLVEGCLRFASDALKWQSKSVPGKVTEYMPAFGFASAPSMVVPPQTDKSVEACKTTLSRETCDTHDIWVATLLEGRQLGGHCFAVRATSTHPRQSGHFCTNQIEVATDGILESTVPNYREKADDRRLADKSVVVTVGGVHGRLTRVSHAVARGAIGEAATKKLMSSLAGELLIAQPQNLKTLAHSFYNAFAHIGSGQCVSAEFSEGLITKTIDSRAAEAQIHNNCPANVSFSASTLAWDASATATKTTSVVLTVPMTKQEMSLIDAIVEETAPVHLMSEEDLDFVMQQTGHYVNVGFVNGKFIGTDYTGGHLDSDKKIALHLIVRLKEAGAGLEEYRNSAAGARSVVEKKLKECLPDALVRVKEIETGLFSAQVVIAAE